MKIIIFILSIFSITNLFPKDNCRKERRLLRRSNIEKLKINENSVLLFGYQHSNTENIKRFNQFLDKTLKSSKDVCLFLEYPKSLQIEFDNFLTLNPKMEFKDFLILKFGLSEETNQKIDLAYYDDQKIKFIKAQTTKAKNFHHRSETIKIASRYNSKFIYNDKEIALDQSTNDITLNDRNLNMAKNIYHQKCNIKIQLTGMAHILKNNQIINNIKNHLYHFDSKILAKQILILNPKNNITKNNCIERSGKAGLIYEVMDTSLSFNDLISQDKLNENLFLLY